MVEEQMLKKDIEVRFITRYAPMINPAELCFNFLRQKTERSRSRNYERMKLAIEEAVKLLNEENRTVDLGNTGLIDDFGPYDVHVYKIGEP